MFKSIEGHTTKIFFDNLDPDGMPWSTFDAIELVVARQYVNKNNSKLAPADGKQILIGESAGFIDFHRNPGLLTEDLINTLNAATLRIAEALTTI